jgi:hypothetical protein
MIPDRLKGAGKLGRHRAGAVAMEWWCRSGGDGAVVPDR